MRKKAGTEVPKVPKRKVPPYFGTMTSSVLRDFGTDWNLYFYLKTKLMMMCRTIKQEQKTALLFLKNNRD